MNCEVRNYRNIFMIYIRAFSIWFVWEADTWSRVVYKNIAGLSTLFSAWKSLYACWLALLTLPPKLWAVLACLMNSLKASKIWSCSMAASCYFHVITRRPKLSFSRYFEFKYERYLKKGIFSIIYLSNYVLKRNCWLIIIVCWILLSPS